jgi:serine/threonine protein kinase
MSLIGKTLGNYEITALLGRGGMGEVYRATDKKLRREVALKVLPHELSGDPERSARFDREARTLASLQHANVASIYGFENVDGIRFLVMELVEGENLEHRLAEGPVPVDECLRIARQMASGLEVAHDTGIVHRDLKPANVMLTRAGDVKILDFGLARAWFGDKADEENINTSPTITAAMTQAGTILGTAAYMSPEQARGKNVDRRADIWAFGVILWEMVTGSRLFEGETISDTLAAVLRAEPEWERLPVAEHPVLCRLIERCLVRDPRQRLRDIGEARILLQQGNTDATSPSMMGIATSSAESTPAPPARSSWPAVAVAAAIALLVGAVLGWKFLASAPEPPLLHLTIPPPSRAEFGLSSGSPGLAVISPDGSLVVFSAQVGDEASRLYLRHLDRGESVALSGTEGAAYPFWSFDSQSIGFFTFAGGGKLKKIAVAGGPPVTLCPAENGKGGSWNREGIIIFAPSHDQPIHRVASIGGDPEPVTQLKEGEDSHRHPRFLPNGRDFLFLARSTEGDAMHSIRIASLDGGEARELTKSQCQAEYSQGNLLIAREGVLVATAFDLAKETLVGGATPLVEDLLILEGGSAVASYSTSSTGALIFQTGAAVTARILQWAELGGDSSSNLPTIGDLHHPKLSPDGTRCVVEVNGESQEGTDLWMVDLASGLRTRFTFEPGAEQFACWMPDGQSVVYVSLVSGSSKIMMQPVSGVGGSSILYESKNVLRPFSVSPDATTLLYDEQVSGNSDVLALDLTGAAEPRELVATEENEGGAQFSPDGRWIAFHQQSAASYDVFVIPAGGGARKWQVTPQGGVYPLWSADGRELIVCGFDGEVTAYEVDFKGMSFVLGSSRLVATSEDPSAVGVTFGLHPDGKRILRTNPDPASKSDVSLLHFVTDWRRGLSR